MADTVMVGRLGQALLDVLDPLRRAAQSPEAFEALMRREGWQPPQTREYFATVSDAFKLVGALETAAGAVESLLSGSATDASTILAAIDALVKVINDIRAIPRPSGALPPPFDNDQFWSTFSSDLIADLFTRYMEVAQPTLFAPLHLLGVLDEETVDPAGAPNRLPYTRATVQWRRLVTLVTDPALLARDVYGWGGTFDHDKLMRRLERVLLAFGIPVGRYIPHKSLVDLYYAGNPPPDGVRELRVPLVEERRADVGFVRAGMLALAIPPTGSPAAAPVGFFVGPYVVGQATANIPLGGSLTLHLKGGLEAAGDVGVEVRPGATTTPRLDGAAATLAMALELIAQPSTPWTLIGDEDGERVELIDFTVGLELTGPATDAELRLRLHSGGLQLVIDPSAGDSFLQKIFGSERQTLQVSCDLVWSSKTGLHFDGQARLQLVFPINATFGPASVRQIAIAIEAKAAQSVAMTAGVTGHGALGPVDVAVENMGLALSLTPVQPPARGTFGDLDLAFGFKPPTGVGLSIDTAAVDGAGFLLHDPAQHLYAGAAQLTVRGRFGLDVAGLVTTRLPDGSDGYSLVLLGALQFQPIPIGFGFSLNELGALIGINRTTDLDAMTGALAAGDLDAVLFPRSPSALATVPAALGKLFPPKEDVHVIGVLAGFTWGPSSLARIEVGFIYDTSAPERLVAVGRLTIARPQITLHLLAIGVLDFDIGELDLQARLVESRLLGADLSGDAAIMVRWGRDRDLVLSIGGFHPAYKPPTAFTHRFAPLRRVTLRAQTDESVLRLGFQAYLAVTSNTVQMGARVDFGVTVSAFSVDGMVSFDGLIQLDPELYIDVRVRGSVAVKVADVTLIGASVSAQLIGPGNWYVDGSATISILWWDVDFGFTIGEQRVAPSLPPVDGAALVAAALADARSWGTQAAPHALVSVRRPTTPGGVLLFHPLDELEVRQQVVPLGVVVNRLDAGPLAAPRTFDVAVTIGNAMVKSEPINDAFARSKYVNMNDAARLSAPSFEQMPSGVRVSLDPSSLSAPAVTTTWTFDEFIWTAQGLRSSTVRAFAPDVAAVSYALATSAAADARHRRTGVMRYFSAG